MVKDLCFEIIEKCPNECKFCSSNSCIEKTKIISFEDFKRVIDYFMSKGGIGELSLSGGEPLLHPDIFKMIEYSKQLGIKTVLFTSGVKKRKKLDQQIIDYYLEELDLETMKKHGIKYYSIYENLEEINPVGGKRTIPLCQKVYKHSI